MIDRDDALEDGYREEVRYYTQALRLAEQILTALGQRTSIDSCIQQLQALFQQIACVEARIGPLAERATQSNEVGRTGWKEAKADVAALLEQLIRAVRQGEREAIARRDTLILPVDMGIRVRRMQQAYGHGA